MNPTNGIATGVLWLRTAPGHLTSGTFVRGDSALDATGLLWVCTASGTPGTWSLASSIGPGVVMWPSTGGVNKTAVLPTVGTPPPATSGTSMYGNGTSTGTAPAPGTSPATWTVAAMRAGLAEEGLYFSCEAIRAWPSEHQHAVWAWLLEAPLRQNDFSRSTVPYPAWLDSEVQDESPPC